MTPQRLDRITEVLNHRQAGLSVVLENIFDPRNIAAVMRSCDAVGIQDIYLLNTHPDMRKAGHNYNYRSSRSANKWLTVHPYDNLEKCITDLRRHFDKIFATHLSTDATNLYEIDFTQDRTVLAFGNEQYGLTEEFLKHADGNIVIPQIGMIKSLNISVACAISIYEAYRQKNAAGHYQQPTLPTEQMEVLKKEWTGPEK